MKDTVERTASNFSQILLWFGATVSISEIIRVLGPLGIMKGLVAIVSGHIIGAAI